VGSGRTSVLRALAGATPSASGELWINSARVRWPRSPRRARALGIALLPEDRKTQGVNLARSGAENIVMSDLGAVARAGFLTTRDIIAAAERAATGFGINAAVLSKPAGTLSGGNQQKLLLARWAHSLPTVLLADEPTRGIDVGAKQEILAHLEHLAAQGMSIIIASSELEEVVQISHRILVLAEGRVVGLLDNSERTVAEHDILRTIFESDREGHGDEHVATG
jgi:ABC-type sugar transport system ATPase subunit